MTVLKKSLLLAATLAITTTVIAAPTTTSPPQEWTYWLSNTSSSASLNECASYQIASVRDALGVTYIHRSSDTTCGEGKRGSVGAQGEEVVLFKREAVDISERGMGDSWRQRALEALSVPSEEVILVEQDQVVFGFEDRSPSIQVLNVQDDSLLVALTKEKLATVDMHSTWDTRLKRLDFRPVSSFFDKNQEDKPEPVYAKPKYNNHVADLASTLSSKRILQDLRILTGEDKQPADVGEWHSRHSATYGARIAAKWLKRQMQESLVGVNASCDFWEYSPFFAPNIVCSIPSSSSIEGQEEGQVVVSAHYDSRGTFGSTTAPGGDDDGSGTAALLAIARSLGSTNLNLASPVQLILFSGEEQGLVGSSHYASHLSSLNTHIKLAIQMDMLAYRSPGEPLQLAFPDKFVTQSATDLIWQVAELYVPELTQGYTPACCSDHQSFWENGFPATWVFERNGPIKDPMYHNSGDVSQREGYDVEQLRAIAKVVLATLFHVAGFE